MEEDKPFKVVAQHAPDTPVAPVHGIAAIALELALRYHNITTVHDGTLYQQYKLEGKNLVPLQLDMVFETAMQIEAHLLGASDRIAALIVDALKVETEEKPDSDVVVDTPISQDEGNADKE